jgi:hypothetical protein
MTQSPNYSSTNFKRGVPLPPVSPNFTQRHPRSPKPRDRWQARFWLAAVESPPTPVPKLAQSPQIPSTKYRGQVAPTEPSLPSRSGKSAEARRLRVVTPEMQNPAPKPGRKNACVPQPPSAAQVRKRLNVRPQPPSAGKMSHSIRMANKIRNYPSTISLDAKKIFQRREKRWEACHLPVDSCPKRRRRDTA